MRRCTVLLLCCLGALSAAETQTLGLAEGFSLSLPASWQAEPAGAMRVAQYRIPAEAGEAAELVVYHFGARGAGDAAANIERWLGQFQPAERQHERATGAGVHGEWTLLQVVGTYDQPIGPPMAGRKQPTPGSAMLAAILPSPAGPYYLKLTGPEQLVLAQRPQVEAILRGE